MAISEWGWSNELCEPCCGSRQRQPGPQLLWHIGAWECPTQEERLIHRKQKSDFFQLEMILPPEGIWQCWSHWLWVVGRVVATGVLWVESRGGTKKTIKGILRSIGQFPIVKNYPVQNVSVPNLENPELKNAVGSPTGRRIKLPWTHWLRLHLYMKPWAYRVRKIMKYLLNFYSSLCQRHQNTTVKSGSRLESGGLSGGNCEVSRQGGINK